MSNVRFNLSISLDGYVAGPDQSLENPLGVGGLRLHDWAFPLAAFQREHGAEGNPDEPGLVNASTQVVEEQIRNVGAVIMGRNMFGGHPGPWRSDAPWTGWWGDNPPYHAPVFVITHHPRASLEMQGGTTFHFVTDGIDAALARARAAAGGKDIVIGGGASIVRQYLAAGAVDEANITISPVLLGSGERLFDQLGNNLRFEQVRAIDAPGVTHIKYRAIK
jgi:dihydrofolate reductase